MKVWEPRNIVEPNDPVKPDPEYFLVVNPIFDWEKERNRVIGRISK